MALLIGILFHKCMEILYQARRSGADGETTRSLVFGPTDCVKRWVQGVLSDRHSGWASRLWDVACSTEELVIAYMARWQPHPPSAPTPTTITSYDFPVASLGEPEQALEILEPFPWSQRLDLPIMFEDYNGEVCAAVVDHKSTIWLTPDWETAFWQTAQSVGAFHLWAELCKREPSLPEMRYFITNVIGRSRRRGDPPEFYRSLYGVRPERVAIWIESMKHAWGEFEAYQERAEGVPDEELWRVVPQRWSACQKRFGPCPRLPDCLSLIATSTVQVVVPALSLPHPEGEQEPAPIPTSPLSGLLEQISAYCVGDEELTQQGWAPLATYVAGVDDEGLITFLGGNPALAERLNEKMTDALTPAADQARKAALECFLEDLEGILAARQPLLPEQESGEKPTVQGGIGLPPLPPKGATIFADDFLSEPLPAAAALAGHVYYYKALVFWATEHQTPEGRLFLLPGGAEYVIGLGELVVECRPRIKESTAKLAPPPPPPETRIIGQYAKPSGMVGVLFLGVHSRGGKKLEDFYREQTGDEDTYGVALTGASRSLCVYTMIEGVVAKATKTTIGSEGWSHLERMAHEAAPAPEVAS